MADAPRFPNELALPATFGGSLRDQLRQWDLLFPAEQRRLRAQVAWLARLTRTQSDSIFGRLLRLEARMQLPRTTGDAGLNVRETGILARSPLYAEWRVEVETLFERIDREAESGVFDTIPRLLICALPSGVPLRDRPTWPELGPTSVTVPLEEPFGAILPGLADALAARRCPVGLEDVERTWILECNCTLTVLEGGTLLSWESLEPLRREFLRRLNNISRDLRSVDIASEELKRSDLRNLVDSKLAANPHVREFVRAVFLSGNGSLVFGNSFVQWGAAQALQRVQPQVLMALFGVRQKLKPFSSTVLFEDQKRSNPTPDEEDPAGSLVDAVKLAEYTLLAAERVPCYRGHTLVMVGACDVRELRVLCPSVPGWLPQAPVTLAGLRSFVLRWISGQG